MIDEQMSTLTDGWLAGELHDWVGDDGCFLFVSVCVCQAVTFESLKSTLASCVGVCLHVSLLAQEHDTTLITRSSD